MKTRSISQTEIEEKWYLVDAAGQRIGRVATAVAELLLGKNNPKIKDYIDPKVKVIVINSEKIDVAPKKTFTKFYTKYSGYPGGLTIEDLQTKVSQDPTFVLRNAIKGMLPKNKRGNKVITNLKLFVGSEHQYEAQKPVTLDLTKVK